MLSKLSFPTRSFSSERTKQTIYPPSDFINLSFEKQGYEKPFVLKKKTILLFFFEKKHDFILFLSKTEKPHSELFLFIQYHYFQICTIITC